MKRSIVAVIVSLLLFLPLVAGATPERSAKAHTGINRFTTEKERLIAEIEERVAKIEGAGG